MAPRGQSSNAEQSAGRRKRRPRHDDDDNDDNNNIYQLAQLLQQDRPTNDHRPSVRAELPL